ncbi:hypothetical protein TorRG33x02_279940 [Trema orientale]|uniref:Uncharacterized protein n=1 Tax=Trema orientale TaxID=63057 RepID=A0A2P5CME0_TREOI|nr:hypothetical protein TorRG33x02_279940 [Trema orientale]
MGPGVNYSAAITAFLCIVVVMFRLLSGRNFSSLLGGLPRWSAIINGFLRMFLLGPSRAALHCLLEALPSRPSGSGVSLVPYHLITSLIVWEVLGP